MKQFGEVLSQERKKKRISLNHAAGDLLIKKEHLEALENHAWADLPDPTFVKGFLKSYASYLGLDPQHILAIYRRDFDETKFQKLHTNPRNERRFFITPNRIINLIFVFAVIAFIAYIGITYSSVLSAPKLDVVSPITDETTSVPVTKIVGKTDPQATISIGGEFVPVDGEGNFSQEYPLKKGKNVIEIIASKRLSPKSKVTRTVRLFQ